MDGYIATSLSAGAKFDLVGFSMGGLVTRYYLQHLADHQRVGRYISIAAPNHGTLTAYLWPLTAARQMRFGSKFLRDLNADGDWSRKIPATVIWSPLDLMIIPASSSRLPAASERKVAVPMHLLMVTSEKVFRVVEQVLGENIG